MPTSLAVLAGASLVASLLAVPLAAPVSAQNYAVTPQAEFGDCWDHMEAPRAIHAGRRERRRYHRGGHDRGGHSPVCRDLVTAT